MGEPTDSRAVTPRHHPESFAEQVGYPAPMAYDIVTCPYCIDAREQIGTNLAGCLHHAR